MTHVVHVAQPTTEGVPRCVVGLVQQQVSRGWRVTVVSPVEGWLAAEARAAGAAHVPWAAVRSPGPQVARETAELGKILRQARPDLVHLHSAKAGLAGRLALRGSVPTVYQPHAWSFLAAHGPVRRLSLGWERAAVRWAHRVVCVSDAERRDGERARLRLDGRVRVVPNGVDTERFAPQDRQAARQRLGRPDGRLVVCVGRLSEQKGQDVLLEAWPSVRHRVPDAQLVLVGEGPWRERLQQAAGDDVEFASNSTDPRDWYAAADVVVAPSRWEGMALVPLEAGAMARSVVVSDVAGAREAVADGAGAVVPPEDPDALAAALATRLLDPAAADREGLAARRNVVDSHGLEATGERMLAVYAELLARG